MNKKNVIQAKKRRMRWPVILFLMVSLIMIVFFSYAQAEEDGIINELKLFSKAVGVIMEGYVKDVNARDLFYEACKGMVSSLHDPYSQFIDKKQFEVLEISIKGEYSGIGAKIKMIDGMPFVENLRPNSAAEKSGILIGDKILQINSESVERKTIEEISALLRGEAATEVILKIWRQSIKETMDIKIVREKIELKAVHDVRMVGRAIGYLRISDFQDHTVGQIDDAIGVLLKQGMKALIIDLRENGGGLMTQAVALAERFLEKDKLIVSVDSRVKEQKKVYTSTGEKTLPNFKLTILVNGRTASASEIFSAAIQDNKRGIIIGEKTFGKASVQSVVPMDDVTAIKLTTARYIRPNGGIIDGIGVQPDEISSYGQSGEAHPDHQIEKAIELLKEFI